MIGTDELMVLVVKRESDKVIMDYFYLGYATFSSAEMSDLEEICEKEGFYLELDATEEWDYSSIVRCFKHGGHGGFSGPTLKRVP
jgi:hypothetical protein